MGVTGREREREREREDEEEQKTKMYALRAAVIGQPLLKTIIR